MRHSGSVHAAQRPGHVRAGCDADRVWRDQSLESDDQFLTCRDRDGSAAVTEQGHGTSRGNGVEGAHRNRLDSIAAMIEFGDEFDIAKLDLAASLTGQAELELV